MVLVTVHTLGELLIKVIGESLVEVACNALGNEFNCNVEMGVKLIVCVPFERLIIFVILGAGR